MRLCFNNSYAYVCLPKQNRCVVSLILVTAVITLSVTIGVFFATAHVIYIT